MTIVYILAAILMFGLLIAVHELGHFLAAKACGVQVNEFSIGMGPCLYDRKRGETQYSLRLLPIGGFCAMEGEEEQSDNPRALNNQGFWKKFVIFAAGAFMNFLTGFVIVLILYSGAQQFLVAQVAGVAPEFQEKNGVTLQEGDEFYAINGQRVYVYSDVSLLLGLNQGTPLDLVVLRDGEKITYSDLAWDTFTAMDGETYTGYGIYRNARTEPATVLNKLTYSWRNTVDFARIVWLSLRMLVTGEAGLNDVSGPVGIVSTITKVGQQSETARQALDNILYFAALIAVNLAVMNLLPLPALDGGRIFFLVLNAIALLLFRRQIPAKYENYVHFVGLILLLALMVVLVFSDVWKLIQ